MNDETLLAALRALADPTRLQIVRFLGECGCGRAALDEDGAVSGPDASEVCCRVTGVDRINSTVSHHLAVLRDAGLVETERAGKRTLCRLRPETLAAVAATVGGLAR